MGDGSALRKNALRKNAWMAACCGHNPWPVAIEEPRGEERSSMCGVAMT
jgi:hypothetical protein